MKDSFILFTSYAETVHYMTDVEAGKLFKMIFNHELGKDPLDGMEDGVDTNTAYVAFTFIRRQLDTMNEKYEQSIEKQREAGKKGAEKRWNKNRDAIANDSTPLGSDRVPIGSNSTPLGSDSLYEYEYVYKKEKPSKEGKKKKADLLGLDDPVLLAAVKDYENHRKKIKAPLTERALDLALKKLEELAPGNTAAKVEIINQSIINGWKGLFPLKGTKQNCMTREDDLDRKLISDIQSRKPAEPIDWEAYFETG